MSRRHPERERYPAGFIGISAAARRLGIDREMLFNQISAGNVAAMRCPDQWKRGHVRLMIAEDVVGRLVAAMGRGFTASPVGATVTSDTSPGQEDE